MAGKRILPEIRPSQRQFKSSSATPFNNCYEGVAFSGLGPRQAILSQRFRGLPGSYLAGAAAGAGAGAAAGAAVAAVLPAVAGACGVAAAACCGCAAGLIQHP